MVKYCKRKSHSALNAVAFLLLVLGVVSLLGFQPLDNEVGYHIGHYVAYNAE